MVRKKTTSKATKKEDSKVAPSNEKSKPLSKDEEEGINEIAEKIKNLKKQKQANAAIKKSSTIVFSMDDVDEFLKNFKSKEIVAKAAEAASKVPAKKVAKAVVDVNVPKQVKKVAAASLDDILGLSSVGVPQNKRVQNKEVPKKFKVYYDLLVELRGQLSEELVMHTSETLKRSGKEDTGDLSGYGQHMADAGSEAFDRDLALSMVSSEQEALKEVEAAINRIYDGTYGICEQTGEAIAHERLMAVPFTRYSVQGQIEYEKSAKRRKVQLGQVFEDAGEEIPLFTELDPDA
jgi:RNA polymerase-binding transcription factor DksA